MRGRGGGRERGREGARRSKRGERDGGSEGEVEREDRDLFDFEIFGTRWNHGMECGGASFREPSQSIVNFMNLGTLADLV